MTVKRRAKKQTKKKKRLASQASGNRVRPTTATEFFEMPKQEQQIYMSTLNLVSFVRKGVSRTRAMRELGLTRWQVDRFARSALRKLKNGRWAAKSYDHLLRVVVVISNEGLIEVGTRDSRQASKAGKHSAAVHKYLQTGDASALAQFKGKYLIDAAGERIELLTNLEELEHLGSAGVLSFESLYAMGL
jgi:hypothetical protein